eukprot:1193203-Prorocentrum_minimum.AAC.2
MHTRSLCLISRGDVDDTPLLEAGATYATVPVHPGPLGGGYIGHFDDYDSALQENMGAPPCIDPLLCGYVYKPNMQMKGTCTSLTRGAARKLQGNYFWLFFAFGLPLPSRVVLTPSLFDLCSLCKRAVGCYTGRCARPDGCECCGDVRLSCAVDVARYAPVAVRSSTLFR